MRTPSTACTPMIHRENEKEWLVVIDAPAASVRAPTLLHRRSIPPTVPSSRVSSAAVLLLMVGSSSSSPLRCPLPSRRRWSSIVAIVPIRRRGRVASRLLLVPLLLVLVLVLLWVLLLRIRWRITRRVDILPSVPAVAVLARRARQTDATPLRLQLSRSTSSSGSSASASTKLVQRDGLLRILDGGVGFLLLAIVATSATGAHSDEEEQGDGDNTDDDSDFL